jgi:hypothetical protein
MMKHFTVAMLAACVLAAPAHAAVKNGKGNGIPTGVDFGAEIPCTFEKMMPLGGFPFGNPMYGFKFMPEKSRGKGQSSGPGVATACGNWGIKWGPNMGRNFIGVNSDARYYDGSIPSVPIDIIMTKPTTYFHVYAGSSMGGYLCMSASIATHKHIENPPTTYLEVAYIGPIKLSTTPKRMVVQSKRGIDRVIISGCEMPYRAPVAFGLDGLLRQ